MTKPTRPGQRAKPSQSSGAPAPQDVNALLASFNAGRHPEAVELARRMTARYPNYGFGWKALGAALKQSGRDAEALAPMQKAAGLTPGDAEAHNNLAVAFKHLGRLTEAEASCRRALKINPDFAEAQSNLGITLKDLGRLDEAEACCRQALAAMPDFADGWNNLGTVLRDSGRQDEALDCYSRALALRPDFADVYHNLGGLFKDLGQLEKAEASYGEALRIKPDFADALNNLALLFNQQGKSVQALNAAIQSLQLQPTTLAKNVFTDCIKTLRFSEANPDLHATLAAALTEPWGRPAELARVCINLLKLDPDIGGGIARAANVWPRPLSGPELFGTCEPTALAADSLLCTLLVSALINDIEFERFLTLARRALLKAAVATSATDNGEAEADNFHSALARQCFINEYVFSCSVEETRQVEDLARSIVIALEGGAAVPATWLAAIAAYVPLHTLPFASRLLERQWSPGLAPLLAQQMSEPLEEAGERSDIARLTTIEDEVSLLVQRQYEENPYPRWTKTTLAGKGKNILAALREKFPRAPFSQQTNAGVDFLIAGCGTGQHAVETALQYPAARILAVDLSLSSLAYARRKTRELGLSTIEYAQADLLKLGALERRFDVIESAGVLHHLGNPWTGWQVLLSLLRPAGVMRLGFYSALARRDIVRIRDFIAGRAYGTTAEDIRRCRQDLIALEESESFGGVFRLTDFFSTSACRDLLFHVQEHRLTLSDIDTFLRKNRLTFLGFDLDDETLMAYRKRFPNDRGATDLGCWQRFEEENPDTFAAMYQFWIQRAE